VALVACACILHGVASAQESLDARVNALEKIVKKLPGISGIINLRAQYSNLEGTTTGFDVRRARLDLKGSAYAFDYRLQVELAGSPKVLDAYVTWNAAPCFNVKAGQFKIPFSLENPYGPTTLETIDNSMVITGLVGYDDVSGIRANGRDIGITVNGGFFQRDGYRVVEYSAGIFNGSGINATDNDRDKDFAGTVTVKPARHLALAASYLNGSSATIQQGTRHDKERLGAGARYDDGKLLVRGEYLRGNTGGVKSDGYYVVAGYFVASGLQPLVKFERFQRDTDDENTRRYVHTLGVRYIPVKNLQLMLNYSYRNFDDAPRDYNYTAAQLIFSF
jgi:phosphate-selective porin